MSDDTLEKRVTKLEKDMADHKKSAEFASTMVRKIVDVLLKQFGVKLGVVLIALMGTTAFGVETLWDTISSQQSGTATARVIVASMGSAATMHVDRVVCADIYAGAYNITTTNAYFSGTMKVAGAATFNSTLAVTTSVGVANFLGVGAGTNDFAVDAGGNVKAAGTVDITGATTLGSTLAATGTLAVAGDVGVGPSTNKFQITASSGNTKIAGTLGVTGALTPSATSGNLAYMWGIVSTDGKVTNSCGTNGQWNCSGMPTSAGSSGYLWASNGILVIQP